jgi:ribosome maturation factor RimP
MAVPDSDRRRSLETRITDLAEQVAISMGMEAILVEIKGDSNRSIVRTYIDQPSGITLGDCERFSKRFAVVLDVEDWIPFTYVLEVSSPGVNRPLVKEADFQRYCGKYVKIRTRLPLAGQSNFKGQIMSVAEGRITLEIAPGKQVGIVITDIEKANLIADLNMRPQGS